MTTAERNDRDWKTKYEEETLKLFPKIIQLNLKTIPFPKDLKNKTITSCYLFGEIGTGKTVKAAFMGYKARRDWCYEIEGGYRNIMFINTSELLLKFRNSYSKRKSILEEDQKEEKDILDIYSETDLLILDDFGVEKTTDWSFQMLYILVNRRYENMKTTIITSNLSLQQLGEQLNDFRIPSRIQQMCKLIKLTGKDYRSINI